MSIWKRLLVLVLSMFFAKLYGTFPVFAKEIKIQPAPEGCPECCEVIAPSDSMSADDLMRIKYWMKYSKFARDYRGEGHFYLINRNGFKRSRTFDRYRILLYRQNKEIDYKDMTVVTDPQNIKGLAVLSWTYLDPQKDQDIWLWLPSLRKIRRVSQSEADDSFLGSDWTTEEVSTRRWEDETYRMIGEQKFPGFTSEYNGKTYHKDLDCFVIEAIPKRKPWYYSKRIVWLDKKHGGDVYYEIYDSLGRKFKVFLKVHGTWPKRSCFPETYLEVYNLNTGHKSIVDVDNIQFNSGQDKNFFTARTLMRTKW